MNNENDMFELCELVGIKLNNRVLRAATEEGMADENGTPTEKLIKLYENLAKGGVGGIVTGFVAVSKDGACLMPGMVMIDSDQRIDKLAELVNRVHALNTPIICQIAHCGRNGVAGKAFNVNAIQEETIERVIENFAAAAVRAQKAGYDGVELHLAHGYFLSEMLSPHTNKRKDKWGGSAENRVRVVQEIMKKIRAALPSYPVLAKVNGDELYKDGIHADEAAILGKMLQDCGIDALEISCGIDTKQMGALRGKVPTDMVLAAYPGIKTLPKPVKAIIKPLLPSMMKEAETIPKYNVPAAKKIKAAVSIPVIALGGIHDLQDIESTIFEDGIDFVSMSRPLILEPNLLNKYKEQKSQTAKCLSCNNCIIGLYGDPLRCYYGKCKNV